jgi:hypothetical protein
VVVAAVAVGVKIVVERGNVTALEGVIGQAVLDQEVQVIPVNVNGIVIVVERKVQQKDVYLFQILLMNTTGRSSKISSERKVCFFIHVLLMFGNVRSSD